MKKKQMQPKLPEWWGYESFTGRLYVFPYTKKSEREINAKIESGISRIWATFYAADKQAALIYLKSFIKKEKGIE